MQRFLLINVDKFDNLSKNEIDNLPISKKQSLATYDFTGNQLADYINNEFGIDNFLLYPYEL